jgi:hypothetical protein
MRLGYSSVGGGSSFSSYSLTREDLENIVAEHFGFDPATLHLGGIEIPGGEISVSGSSPAQESGEFPSPR